MNTRTEKIMEGVVIAALLAWLAWHLAVPVDFIRSDLGRHIVNGKLILQGQWDVLYKNYYTYTNTRYPFINHHWLFGVFCYLLWHHFGFFGLCLVYLFIELWTFYIFFRCGRRHAPLLLACGIALLSFPLVCLRNEVRPEGISYLCCGIFWWMLEAHWRREISGRFLAAALGAAQVLWVNTHIFFILGPFLTALFAGQACLNGEKPRAAFLQKLVLLLLAACLVNPSGPGAFLALGYAARANAYFVLETQPLFYLLKAQYMPWKSFALYVLLTMGLLGAGLLPVLRREGFKKNALFVLLSLILSLGAIKALRMIGLWGFFWVLLAMIIYGKWLQAKPGPFRKTVAIVLLVSGMAVSAFVNVDWKRMPSLGVSPGINGPAEFFKSHHITGPVFNNFDDGSYLIFHLFPQKVFIDNRLEAFPAGFFTKTYIPMQMDRHVWQKMEKRWRFNAIFFSLDTSPWGIKFMRDRFADKEWATVYYTNKAIIWLKRNAQNAGIIKHNEIKVLYVQL